MNAAESATPVRGVGKDVPMSERAGTAADTADQRRVQMLRAAIAKGWGDQDFCSSIQVLEDWAGVEVKKT